MSLQLRKSNEYKLMIASSPLKNKLYTNETIISLQHTKANEQAYDSFITVKKQLYSNEKLK